MFPIAGIALLLYYTMLQNVYNKEQCSRSYPAALGRTFVYLLLPGNCGGGVDGGYQGCWSNGHIASICDGHNSGEHNNLESHCTECTTCV